MLLKLLHNYRVVKNFFKKIARIRIMLQSIEHDKHAKSIVESTKSSPNIASLFN